MGFETFLVELHGGPATWAQVESMIRQCPHVQPDHDSLPIPGSTYFTLEDGCHVIEIEVTATPVRVSCRFTLCQPPTVDAALLGLVREMQGRLGLAVMICDDVRPEHTRWYSAVQFSEFAGAVMGYIAARRAEWTANFGITLLAAKTPEVYAKIILPRCVPVAS